jgi:hypothetical protein
MKTNQFHNQSHAQGSVLVVSLAIVAIAAIVLGSYLTLVQTQSNSVARSQTWNSALAYAEAGLEEGMAEINRGSPSVNSNVIVTSPWDWTNSIASDGWSTFANGQATLTRYVSGCNAGSNYYTVTIDISSGTPTVTSAGVVAYSPVLWGSYAAQQPFLAAQGVATVTNSIIGRRAKVQVVNVPLFSMAVLTRSNFNMNGNNSTVDSFDSSNTNYSTGGQWDVNKRKANGSVATDSGVVGDISTGNGNIYGHIYTGPGTQASDVQIGPNGAVGDAAWNAGNTGIESNFWVGNFNTAIPDVQTPTFAGLPIPLPNLIGPYMGSIVLNGGNYTAPSGGPSLPLVITAPTTMWVQGSFAIPNVTFTNGGSLVLYVGKASGSGDTLSVSGNGNSPGYAANLQIFGLPSLTSISLGGNNALIAAIYAPEANYSGGGGGNNAADSAGSLVVNSVTLNGHWNFHYDENLANAGASRGWIAKNWTEVKY